MTNGSGEEEREAMECCCYLRNIQDLIASGNTPYERRYDTLFSGPIILLEQRYFIIHVPQKRTGFINSAQTSSKVSFTGYAFNAESGWTGDLLAADAEELKENIASEVYVKRFKENAVGIQKNKRTSPLSLGMDITLQVLASRGVGH